MKKIKKLLALALVMAMAVTILAGCGGKTAGPKTDESGKIVMRFNTPDANHEGTPTKEAIQMFFDDVNAALSDKVDIQYYWGGALGSTTEAIFNGLQTGSYELGNVNPTLFADYTKAFTPLDVPYLITDVDVAKEILSGDLGQQMIDKAAEESGVRVLGFVYMGMRMLSNSKHPVTNLSDMEGLKIRVQSNQLHIAVFDALGAAATPIAYTELYTSLQQGTVDGQENPVVNVLDMKFYEVQPYFTRTNHLVGTTAIVISEPFFQSLPEDVKQVLLDCGKTLCERSFEMVCAAEEEMLNELSEHAQINELTPEAMAEFTESVNASKEKFVDLIGEEYYNDIYNQIQEIAANK